MLRMLRLWLKLLLLEGMVVMRRDGSGISLSSTASPQEEIRGRRVESCDYGNGLNRYGLNGTDNSTQTRSRYPTTYRHHVAEDDVESGDYGWMNERRD